MSLEYERKASAAIAEAFGFEVKEGKSRIYYRCIVCGKRYAETFYGEANTTRMIRHNERYHAEVKEK